MARKPRIENKIGLYHVLNRDNYRSHIFETEGAKADAQTGKRSVDWKLAIASK